MAYSEDVNVNMNVVSGAMGGVAAITNGMTALAANFSALGSEASRAFGSIDGLMVTSTALIAGFAFESAKAYGEFEQGMKLVQAVSGQTNSAINELSSKATEMSVAYRTSINDITDGLQTLGRAGLNSANEQLDVLESGLQTSKLEGRALNGVLEELIQNTAMLGGDLKSVNFGEQSEYVNSLLVGTSMTAPIDSHDVSQTLQYSGGIAAAAGANLESEEGKKKLEDLMGTVAAFAQKGVKGSMAGTALRAFFTKPASQDDMVTNALSELNLTPEDLWEDGGESMKSVSDQVGLIQRRMDSLKMSTMDQVELWGKIVGPKMGQQMIKLDSASIKDLTRDIQSAQSAEDLATQTLQTYTQKISEMEQQGQVAYREFGEKAAFWLRFPIEGATKLLEILSNPAVNTAAFALVGSLLAHGFRKAYGMAQAFYGQVKGSIGEVLSGIESINALAGGSSVGFNKSADQVDFLNRKLQETDSTLQSIQAKSMGIRPGYQLPGGLYTDQVQKRTIKAYEEDVIKDDKGLMGEGTGYFPGQKKELFEESVDKYAAWLEEEFNTATEQLKEDIQSAKSRVETIHSQRQDDFDERMEIEERKLKKELDARVEAAKMQKEEAIKEIKELQGNKKGMEKWNRTGVPIDVQKEAFADFGVQEADAMYGVNSKEFKNAAAPYIEKSKYKDLDPRDLTNIDTTAFDQEIKAAKADYKKALGQKRAEIGKETSRAYMGQIQEAMFWLEELENVEIEDPTLSKAEIKKIKGEAVTKLRTELKLFDEYEFNAWKKRQKNRGAAGKYSLKRAADFYDEFGQVNEDSTIGKLYGEELKEFQKRGYFAVPESHLIPESHPNAQVLGQALNDNSLNEMANARDQIVERQKKELMGKNTLKSRINDRAYEIGSQRLGIFSRSIDKASSATSNFFTKMKNASQERSIRKNARERGKSFWSDARNIEAIQGKALNKVKSKEFQKLNKGADVKTVTSNLRKELGYTATEFSMLVNSEKQYQQVLGESSELIAAEAAKLREAIAATTISEEKEKAANEESIAAEKSEAAASIQSAAAEGAESASSITSGLSGLAAKGKSAISTAIGYMGGPLMAGMMAVTIGMQLVQASQQAWQQEMQKATEALSEAADSLTQAEEDIKQLYSDENSDITDADLDKAVDQQYASVYDSFYNGVEDRASLGTEEFESDVSMAGETNEKTGETNVLTAEEIAARNEEVESITLAKDENIKALNENTMKLAEATAAYNQAQEREAKSFTDDSWGFDSFTADFTDQLGEWQEEVWNVGAWANEYDGRAGFFDNNMPVLTGSQADSDYAGSTEFAGIFAADSFRFDNENAYKYNNDTGEYEVDLQERYEKSLQQFFGSDYDRIISLMGSIDGKISNKYGDNLSPLSTLYTHANNMGQMNAQEMGIAQMSLKNDKGEYQKLGKQMFRYEQSHGFKRSAYKDGPGLLKKKGKLSVQDKNLVTTMKKLLGRTNRQLSEQSILAMGQLQQLQDMQTIANETIAPGIMQTVQGVFSNVAMTSNAGSQASYAGDGAASAANNAAAIAAFLGTQAQDMAEKSAYKKYLRDNEGSNAKIMSEEEFVGQLGNLSNKKMDTYRNQVFMALSGSGWSVHNPEDATPENIKKNAKRLIVDSNFQDKARQRGASYQHMLDTATKSLVSFASDAVTAAYGASNIGEYGSGSRDSGGGSGGGSGSGGGGGSGKGSDKTQNVKNRVDLVLCNKKTIPKLNVNLFKKAPNFTVLNKNFKVRDIKINTEDKPKAIMNAVKNGIIDVQRRTDPKIIQDDEAEYDPTAATDGDNLPHGSTQTTT